jgi:hypothetical protein
MVREGRLERMTDIEICSLAKGWQVREDFKNLNELV